MLSRKKVVSVSLFSLCLAVLPQTAYCVTFEDVKQYSLETINKGLSYVTSSAEQEEQKYPTDNKFTELWNTSLEKMEEGLEYLNSGKSKDYTEWYRIGQNPKFRQIVQETFTILSVSDAKEKIDLVVKCRKEIAALHRQNSELIKKEPGAPEKPQGFFASALDTVNLFESKETIRQEISRNKAKIAQFEDEIEKIKYSFYIEMQSKEIHVSREQVESLFSSIDGEGIIAIIGMAQNMKTIQLELQKLSMREGDNIELLKSYSGMYMMLNETLLFAYQEVIDKIQKIYIPKLETIISESENELAIARDHMRNTSRQNEVILQSNVESNKMTITVGKKYHEYLAKQIAFLNREQERMVDNVAVATNTYNTIRNGGELLVLLNESSKDINRITSFQIPDLEILHEEALRREFSAITARLQL